MKHFTRCSREVQSRDMIFPYTATRSLRCCCTEDKIFTLITRKQSKVLSSHCHSTILTTVLLEVHFYNLLTRIVVRIKLPCAFPLIIPSNAHSWIALPKTSHLSFICHCILKDMISKLMNNLPTHISWRLSPRVTSCKLKGRVKNEIEVVRVSRHIYTNRPVICSSKHN